MTKGHELRALDAIAQGCRFYEQLKVVDNINDLGSYGLRPLDAMNG